MNAAAVWLLFAAADIYTPLEFVNAVYASAEACEQGGIAFNAKWGGVHHCYLYAVRRDEK